jgi:hypothetical protein
VNISALPERLLSWIKGQGAALLQGDKSLSTTFQSDQQYEGKVLDNLANGRHLVRVNNALLDMNLPVKTQVGDTVRLTYVNSGPRPTFLLNEAPNASTGGGSQPVRISNTAQQVNALLRLAQTPEASEPVGAGGQTRPIVANVALLQNFGAATQASTTAFSGPNGGLLGQAVEVSSPLSASALPELPEPAATALPVRLAQTLSESGLFYESHLAKWNRGTLSLDAILREPQARLNSDTHIVAAGGVQLADLSGIPEEAARLAGRQLQMLEGAPFLWQGTAWPGQEMQWSIREEERGNTREETKDTAAEWVTELNLTLPRMGEVHAQLGLTGERLRLRLQVTDPLARAALEAALPVLAQGFEASGLQTIELQVGAPLNVE